MAASLDGIPPDEVFTLPEEGPDDPRPIVAALVAGCPEFDHLRHGEPSVMTVFRTEQKKKSGRLILGTMGIPGFQGGNAQFGMWLLAKLCGGEIPDFILTIDAEWWGEANGREREALVHHELMHCMIAVDKEGEEKFNDEGRPVWAIRPHSLEEFNETVRRYGAWKSDIADFIEAARDGGAVQ